MKEKSYDKKVNKILRTYDSILVKCKNIPIVSDKNIIMVDSIEGMVNTQIETRKPILYYKEYDSVSFMILDGTETYVYIIKANEEKINSVEQQINNIEMVKNTFVKDILSKIEKMLINADIKTENLLTENEFKYLESIREENKEENKGANKNESKSKNANLECNSEYKVELEEDEKNNTSNKMCLVPVKKSKMLWFLAKDKKPKRLKKRKHERRKRIE
jgi:hypothetical protein